MSNPMASSSRIRWEDVEPLQFEEWGQIPVNTGKVELRQTGSE